MMSPINEPLVNNGLVVVNQNPNHVDAINTRCARCLGFNSAVFGFIIVLVSGASVFHHSPYVLACGVACGCLVTFSGFLGCCSLAGRQSRNKYLALVHVIMNACIMAFIIIQSCIVMVTRDTSDPDSGNNTAIYCILLAIELAVAAGSTFISWRMLRRDKYALNSSDDSLPATPGPQHIVQMQMPSEHQHSQRHRSSSCGDCDSSCYETCTPAQHNGKQASNQHLNVRPSESFPHELSIISERSLSSRQSSLSQTNQAYSNRPSIDYASEQDVRFLNEKFNQMQTNEDNDNNQDSEQSGSDQE